MRRIQLDSLRFFAIIVVMLHHLELFNANNCIGKYFNNPTWGVDFFFILSGFGLYVGNENVDLKCSVKSGINFAMQKIKKMYCIYFIALVLCIPYSIYYDLIDFSFEQSLIRAIVKLLISATLLQTLTGMGATHYALNSPVWFLSCLFVSYMLLPWLLKYVKRIKNLKIGVINILCIYGIIQLLSIFFIQVENKIGSVLGINSLWYSSFYIRVFYVLLGMCIARVCKYLKRDQKRANYEEILVCAGIIGWYFLRNISGFNNVFLRYIDVLLAALTVFVFSFGEGIISKKVLKRDFLVQLGRDTWFLFLIHWPVLKLEYIFILSKVEKIEGITKTALGNIQFVLFSITLVAIIFIYRHVCVKNKKSGGLK